MISEMFRLFGMNEKIRLTSRSISFILDLINLEESKEMSYSQTFSLRRWQSQ